MRVGFTGTRRGLTARQRIAVKAWLDQLSVVYTGGSAKFDQRRSFIHGGCVGADEEAQKVALDAGYDVAVFWGDDPKQQMLPPPSGDRRFTTHARQPMLARNRDIVDGCDVLLVAPRARKEVLRSGTWATYRYAQKVGRDCIMLWP